MSIDKLIDYKQYMFARNNFWPKLKEKLIENRYENEVGTESFAEIVADNERKWFYPVPGIFMYWKYILNRKPPLTQLSAKDILDNFEKLIIEKDINFYNKLIRS